MLPHKYEILRGVENSSKILIPLENRPKQVWTLLNEEEFLKMGLVHWKTGFIEDSMHDWDWNNGQFRFYGHSGAPGDKHDLVIIYPQTLREVLPKEFEESYMTTCPRYPTENAPPSPASLLLDVIVTAEHSRGRVKWPGNQKHVYKWWELEDGHAVGWNENVNKGWSFPVLRIRRDW